jgi:hypothetical protein
MSISAPQKQRESIRELNRHPVANPKMTCFQTLRARSRRYSWKSTSLTLAAASTGSLEGGAGF